MEIRKSQGRQKDARAYYQSRYTTYFFTIDPGARESGGTGLAYHKTPENTIYSKCVDSPHSNYTHRQDHILEQLELEFLFQDRHELATVFIERPYFWKDSNKSKEAAESNSLFKLISLYGRIYQLAKMLGMPVVPLEIVHWKGQLNKKQTAFRLKKKCNINPEDYNSDELDAMGMVYYLLGMFP